MIKTLASLHPSLWSIAGLTINLLGVGLLFRWGIPYYVRTGGAISIVTEQIDKEAAREEHFAGVIGWIGLGLVRSAPLYRLSAAISLGPETQ
jgi:hypothetical protein